MSQGLIPRTLIHAALLALLASFAAPTIVVADETSAFTAHAEWTSLLQRCVTETADGHSTAVDYACFDQAAGELNGYLSKLSAVSPSGFGAWPRDEQLAFLINAYNAWTVELILQAWPDLESIKDLGSLFRSPWKKSFIPLLGDTVSLDDIEHGMIREPGRFDEPRIHFAVNCASIGCPALRREAYTAADLESQLEDQTQSFLADPSRNRLAGTDLEVSSLFTWYGDDFASGWRGADTVEKFLARYADALGLDDTARRALIDGDLDLEFLNYDWSLNSTGSNP